MFSNLLIIILFPNVLIRSSHLFVSCVPQCDLKLGETVPTDLTYASDAPMLMPIWKIWETMIQNSVKSIRLTSFYWTMLNNDVSNTTNYTTSKKGKEVFEMLLKKSKLIPLEIVQNGSVELNDLSLLKKNKLVKIFYIDFSRLLGEGIQHSKVWITDNRTAFIGSPNMDWRSISEVKELGVMISNCSDFVQDVDKFWQTLQFLSGPSSHIPVKWPPYFSPKYNHTNPLTVIANGILSNIYTATSPPSFNPAFRTNDLTAIQRTIDRAQKFVYISVMDYIPLSETYQKINKYWPEIEDHLKTAAIDKGITVKLLISLWKHTDHKMLNYLKSLKVLSNNKVKLYVKVFIVPAFQAYQKYLPFSRVSHSKYMVTDNTAYIGTSNWSGDYYISTGGISFVTEEKYPNPKNNQSLRTNLEQVFNTDWYSIYAHDFYV